MKLYRMRFVLKEPSEETEDRYLAEIPDLPGCRAWGDTAAQAMENLRSVAIAFIESCRDRGDPIPWRALSGESAPAPLGHACRFERHDS